MKEQADLASHPDRQKNPSVTGLIAGLLIDYLRWTQLVPMIFAWAFLLFSVAAVVAINFQQSVEAVVLPILDVFDAWEWLEEVADEDGQVSISLGDADIKGFVYKAWAALAAVGYLLGMLVSLVTGPRPPMPLGRKLVLAAVPAVLASAAFFLAWLFGSETFTGAAAGWVAMFLIGPLVVWLISAYSLSVGHVLEHVKRQLQERL